MRLETWTEYVERVLDGISRKEAAAMAHVSEPTLSRWVTATKRPSAENVVEFARAFNQDAVKALIAAGYLRPEDISGGMIEVYQSRAELSDSEIIAELTTRLAERPKRPRVEDITTGLTLGDDAG